MTLEQNITAILESCFSGFKDELIEACAKRIMEQIEGQADTPQTKQSNSEYYLELADAVMRGEMSDASANQAWYEYINKQDTPQTEVGYCNECRWFRDKQVCGRCRSLNLFAKADTPQTDIHGITDCDFCKGKNCEDCEGGKDEPQTAQKIAEFQKMCGIEIDPDRIRQTDCGWK